MCIEVYTKWLGKLRDSSYKRPRYTYGWPKFLKSVRMKKYLRQINLKTILLVIFCSSILPTTYAESQGIFELRLKGFANKLNKDSQGHCCDGYRTSSGRCSGSCLTKFRVCLKHYQLDIDPSHECTFGEHITAPGDEKRGGIIKFPLDFKWPGTFSLIVEAWHENNKTSGKTKIIYYIIYII